jgi:hypothetical protein
MADPWPQDRTDLLMKLHAEGYSSGVIAMRMGRGLTRNAVMGKIDRLRKAGVIRDEAHVQLRSRGPKGGHCQRSQPRIRKLTNMWTGSPMQPRVMRKDTRTPVPLPRADDIPRITFADLARHHCRFICCAEAGKAVAAGDKLYCGNQVVEGTSYCAGHLARTSRDIAEFTPKQREWWEKRQQTKTAMWATESPEELPA